MLRIHLLGSLRLFHDDQPWKLSAPPRTLPLLAYLLLHRAAPLPRDRLAFTLWADDAEPAARANLRRHLSYLQRALPAPAGDRPWLLADHEGVQWNPEADAWLDVAEFERLSADPNRLAEAAALYTGDLLLDLYDDWVFGERERLRQLYFDVLGRVARRCRQRGDYEAAIDYTRQLLQRDPLREAALRDLVALSYESGDRTGAIQEFKRFEQRLREELGVAPMPETIELYERIRSGQADGAAVEQARQAAGQIAPPHSRPAAPQHNLPAQLTSFVGREEELRALQYILASPNSGARLLTLTGPGGAGKTRLALEAAGRLLAEAPDQFPDGLYFVALSEIAEAELVAPAVAQALGLVESGSRSPAASLQDFVRTRQMLLILDNFEQVTDAAPLAAELLAAAPGLRILVTSRAVLQLYGEHEFPVPPLGLPDVSQLAGTTGTVSPQVLDELAKYTAVALFVERSQAARLDFSLTGANAAAVAEICVRLDGLPLAIELAAARSKLFTPTAMLERLNSRLAFLQGAARARTPGLAARQQTLRGAIDWSYGLLSVEEQRLFARLGVFAGGFSAEAAEAVARQPSNGEALASLSSVSPMPGLEALAGLADQSMLRLEAGEAGEPRFRMLLTLREYALERLAEHGETAAMRERHAGCYLALAEQAAPELSGPRQVEWLRRLETEHDNLRAALDWGQQGASDAALGLRLAVALGQFWHRRSFFREGRRWLEAALARWPAAPAGLRAGALDFIGVLARDQSDYPAARAALEDSAALWRSLGDQGRPGLAWTLRNQGMLAYHQEQLDEAERSHAASLALQRELGNTLGIAAALNSLGVIAYGRGDFAGTRARCQESLPLARAGGDLQLMGDMLNMLGVTAQALGDYAEARARLTEALDIYRQLGDRYGQAIATNNLSNATRPQGDLGAARAYAEESMALYRDVGSRAKVGWPLFHLGAAALRQGDLETALASFEAGLATHREHNNRSGILQCIEGLAWLALAQDRPERAARLLSAADAIRQAGGTRPTTVPTRTEQEQALAEARAGLSPEAFDAAWAAGRALTLEQAVAEALLLDSAS